MLRNYTLLLFAIAISPIAVPSWPAHSPRALAAGEAFPRKDSVGDVLPRGAVARCGTTRLRQEPGRSYPLLASVAYSPDGKLLLTGGGKVRLFDAATGLPSTPALIPNATQSAGFSADGKWLAASSLPPSQPGWNLLLRDVAKGTASTLDTRQQIISLAFSRDGQYVATGGSSSVALVDVKARSVKARWKVFASADVQALAFSPDGKFLVAGGGWLQASDENDVQVWDVAAEKAVARLKGHERRVMALGFVLGGKVLASGSLDGTVRLWDVAKWKEIGRIHTSAVRAWAIAPDGKLLATSSCEDDVVRLWDVDGRKKLGEVVTDGKAVSALAFSPDGKHVATGGYSRTVRIWDVATGKEVLPLPGHREEVVTIAFTPDGKTLISRGCGRTIRFWDPTTGKEQRQFQLGDLYKSWFTGICVLALSPDGRRLAAIGGTKPAKPGVRDPSFHVWDVKSGKRIADFVEDQPPPTYPPPAIALSPDGEVLASAALDVRLWSVSTGKGLAGLDSAVKAGGALCVAFSPDGRTLAAGMQAREGEPTLQLWDWTTRQPLYALPAHERTLAGLAFSPGGQLLATCGGRPLMGVRKFEDPVARLWEVSSGTLVRAYIAHDDGAVASVAVSPDGRLVATGGDGDNTVRVWNAFTGDELAKFKGHLGPVNTVAFSPDGKRLASGSADTTILIWDVSRLKATPPATDTDPDNLRKLWDTLRRHDAAKPYEALWSLVGAGNKAVALFDKELRPFPTPAPDKLRQLLADLDNNDPETRDKASAELAKLGPLAEPALREAGKATRSAEVRRRIDDLLARLRGHQISEEELRQGRAVLALELIGTPAARDLLRRLGEGAAGAPLTRDAKAALRRLNK